MITFALIFTIYFGLYPTDHIKLIFNTLFFS